MVRRHDYSTWRQLNSPLLASFRGEAIFGLGSVLSGDKPDGMASLRTSTVLADRLRLELKSSFQGSDLLFTRLSQGNFSGFANEIDTFQGSLAFAEPDDSDFRARCFTLFI